jgi:Zn finger protein HypA/HybF involved in hydrogenase expression
MICSCGAMMVSATYGRRCPACGRVERDAPPVLLCPECSEPMVRLGDSAYACPTVHDPDFAVTIELFRQ